MLSVGTLYFPRKSSFRAARGMSSPKRPHKNKDPTNHDFWHSPYRTRMSDSYVYVAFGVSHLGHSKARKWGTNRAPGPLDAVSFRHVWTAAVYYIILYSALLYYSTIRCGRIRYHTLRYFAIQNHNHLKTQGS